MTISTIFVPNSYYLHNIIHLTAVTATKRFKHIMASTLSNRRESLGPHALHPGASFEGFCTKFSLPSGSTLILIPCTVPRAPAERRHSLMVVYVPPWTPPAKARQRDRRRAQYLSKFEEKGHAQKAREKSEEWGVAPCADPDTNFTAECDDEGDGDAEPHVWNHEIRPAQIVTQTTDRKTRAFVMVCLDAEGKELASFASTPEKNTYRVNLLDIPLNFEATTTCSTPWSRSSWVSSSPESWLGYLPLPLHWHVHSLSSHTSFTLELPSHAKQHLRDHEGEGVAHEEKNWANSFPSAHVWCQARSPPSTSTCGFSRTAEKMDRITTPTNMKATGSGGALVESGSDIGSGICLAGGQTLGLNAFLVGYRHHSSHSDPSQKLDIELDFRPPFALGLPIPWLGISISPFLIFDVDWPARRWAIDVSSLRWRLTIEASGPGSQDQSEGDGDEGGTGRRGEHERGGGSKADPGTGWYTLSAPKIDGFHEHGMAQTVHGTVTVTVFRRRLGWQGWSSVPWTWEQVCEETFEGAGVEFGGGYYSAHR